MEGNIWMAAPRGPGAGRPRWDVMVRLFPKHRCWGSQPPGRRGSPSPHPVGDTGVRGRFSPSRRRWENTPFAPKPLVFLPKDGRRQADVFPDDVFGQRWSKKRRRGELYREVSPRGEKETASRGKPGRSRWSFWSSV